MGDSFKKRIEEMKDWLVEIRRTIHMHPELGFEEVETSKLVAEWLEKFGLKVREGDGQDRSGRASRGQKAREDHRHPGGHGRPSHG